MRVDRAALGVDGLPVHVEAHARVRVVLHLRARPALELRAVLVLVLVVELRAAPGLEVARCHRCRRRRRTRRRSEVLGVPRARVRRLARGFLCLALCRRERRCSDHGCSRADRGERGDVARVVDDRERARRACAGAAPARDAAWPRRGVRVRGEGRGEGRGKGQGSPPGRVAGCRHRRPGEACGGGRVVCGHSA